MGTTPKNLLICTALALLSAMTLTSCVDNEGVWWDNPPYGWETYNDPRLEGCWKLVQYNSYPVYDHETNYLCFDGYGGGYFYYLDNGYEQRERIRYYCQESYGGASNSQLNIQYEFSSPITTNYWFTNGNNNLWMQWQTYDGHVETYVYDRVNRVLW